MFLICLAELLYLPFIHHPITVNTIAGIRVLKLIDIVRYKTILTVDKITSQPIKASIFFTNGLLAINGMYDISGLEDMTV